MLLKIRLYRIAGSEMYGKHIYIFFFLQGNRWSFSNAWFLKWARSGMHCLASRCGHVITRGYGGSSRSDHHHHHHHHRPEAVTRTSFFHCQKDKSDKKKIRSALFHACRVFCLSCAWAQLWVTARVEWTDFRSGTRNKQMTDSVRCVLNVKSDARVKLSSL